MNQLELCGFDDVGVAQVVALPKLVAEDDDGLSVLAERRIGGHQCQRPIKAFVPQ